MCVCFRFVLLSIFYGGGGGGLLLCLSQFVFEQTRSYNVIDLSFEAN